MKAKVVDILDQNRLMALATLRPDGWPQNTIVGYANEDIIIYFIVSRGSQKLGNMEADNRVSIAIGRDFHDPASVRALSIAAFVDEVRDARQRERAIDLLLERRPGLKQLDRPTSEHSAIMRASPSIISILDYSKGFGHTDLLTVGPGGVTEMTAERDDDWGYGPAGAREQD